MAKIQGKTILVTGSLSKKRDLIAADINRAGAIFTNSMTTSVDYLVTNNSKLTRKRTFAQRYNIPIITEWELYAMIDEYRNEQKQFSQGKEIKLAVDPKKAKDADDITIIGDRIIFRFGE